MKKTELKALLKVITEEVVAAKNEAAGSDDAKAQELLKQYNDLLKQHDWYYQYSDDPSEFRKGEASFSKINGIRRMLNDMGYAEQAANVYKERTAFLGANRAGGVQETVSESKGLSGFKKSKESTEHTEKIASSKDLTGKGPVEKKEGKKLPVVKKPANPQKVGSIKEEIIQMIREEIEEAMGRPKLGGSGAEADANTTDAIEGILQSNPNAKDSDILRDLVIRVKEEGEVLNLDKDFVQQKAAEIRGNRSAETSDDNEDAPESDLAAMASAEEKRKAAQRAAWIKKLQAKRGMK